MEGEIIYIHMQTRLIWEEKSTQLSKQVKMWLSSASGSATFSLAFLVVLISVPKLTLSACISQKLLTNCHPNGNRLVILSK